MAFALEAFSIYSEVIISEWKMFVPEGKAVRSAVESHPHAAGSAGSSASQGAGRTRGDGAAAQGRRPTAQPAARPVGHRPAGSKPALLAPPGKRKAQTA